MKPSQLCSLCLILFLSLGLTGATHAAAEMYEGHGLEPLAPTDFGYAYNNYYPSSRLLVRFTLNNFTNQTHIGPSGTIAYYGIDFDPTATILYALNDNTDQLGTINLTTGAFTAIAPCPPPDGASYWTGLTIHPVTGVFYASTEDSLYTVNPANGISTLVGAFGPVNMMAIAINRDGDMYGLDVASDALNRDYIYKIDPDATGELATQIGRTGYEVGFHQHQSLDFDNDDGTLYIFLHVSSGNNLYGTVNLVTGDVTPLSVANNPKGQFEGATKTVVLDVTPSLSINKTVTDVGGEGSYGLVDAAGDVISYSILVSNTGNQDLTGVSVADPLLSNEDCDGSPGAPYTTTGLSIAVGGSLSCSGSYTALQSDIDNNGGGDGDIDNTATADSNQTDALTDSEAVPLQRSPAIDVEKFVWDGTAFFDADAPPGPTLPLETNPVIKFVVTNTGSSTLTGLSLSDSPAIANFYAEQALTSICVIPATLAPAGTFTCYGSLSWDIGLQKDTATADSNESLPDTDDAYYFGATPALNVTKLVTAVGLDTSAPFAVDAAGDVISYSILVENIGNVPLTSVYVSDLLLSDLDCDAQMAGLQTSGLTIPVGSSLSCTGTYTVTQADMDAGGNHDMSDPLDGQNDVLLNTVMVGSYQTNEDASSANVPVVQNPAIQVIKSSTTASVGHAGQVVPYTITVSNPGNVTLTGVSVSDPLVSNLDCDTFTPGSQTTGLTITVGGSLNCTGSYTVLQGDLDSNGGGDGDIDNTASADSSETTAVNDLLAIPISEEPALQVLKASPTTSITTAGQVVPYTFAVSNTGNLALAGITVNDAKCDAAPAYQSGDGNSDGMLDLTEVWNYTCNHTVTQVEIDAATGANPQLHNEVTADSTESGPDTGQHDIPILANPALTIAKSVIGVDGDTTDPVVDAAGDVISYSILVSNSGNQTLTGVTVSDPLLGALSCAWPGPAGTLLTGQSVTCTGAYTVQPNDISSFGGGDGDIDNIATAGSAQTQAMTDSVAVSIIRNNLFVPLVVKS